MADTGYGMWAKVMRVVISVCCAMAACCLIRPDIAWADQFLQLTGSSPADGSVIDVDSTITLSFNHNVGEGVYSVSLSDESGVPVSVSASGSGGSLEVRRSLIVQPHGMQPGTTYYMTYSGRSAGGNGNPDGSLYSVTLTFTTAGSPPEPDPEPPPEPDPAVPPDGGGGGGQGGSGGSGMVGAGVDQGGSYGSGTTPGTSSETDATDATVAPSSQDTAPESSIKSGQSRAAGTGGGTVYVVGQTGKEVGEAPSKEQVETPLLSWQFVAVLCLIAVGLVLSGMVKRGVVWHRHVSHGGHIA